MVAFATSNVHVAFASQPFDSYRTKFHANPKHACMIKPAGLAPEQSSCSIVFVWWIAQPVPQWCAGTCCMHSSVVCYKAPNPQLASQLATAINRLRNQFIH